ncbi:hypothetical protein ACSDR0_06870 [Streptosporangium sp. G11]|uniref:hypothetical protein n=1 Tax=Streptosporangium sp. G11 TaxID=3436926 RepID=UPI003EC11113
MSTGEPAARGVAATSTGGPSAPEVTSAKTGEVTSGGATATSTGGPSAPEAAAAGGGEVAARRTEGDR